MQAPVKTLSLVASLLWLAAGDAAAQRGAVGGPEPMRWTTGPAGPRRTIVYLHGLGCEPNDPVIRRLVREFDRRRDGYLVVAPWLRPVAADGRGKLVEAGPHTMSDQLQRARRVIEQQEGRVVLMGHSFGGKAALQLAREYPHKVACVVGLAPSVNMLYSYWKRLTGERGLPADTHRLQRTIAAHRDRLGAELQRALGRADRKAADELRSAVEYADVMRDLTGFNEPGVESGVRTPTLVLQGTADEAVSIHYSRRFAQQNPGVRLFELEGVSHAFRAPQQPLRDVTREMAPRITSFINQHLESN